VEKEKNKQTLIYMFSAAFSSSPKTLPPLAPLRKPDRSSACHDRGFNKLPTIPALMAIFFNSPSKKNSSYKGGKKKGSQNHRFCHKIPSTYIHRDAIKKKKTQKHSSTNLQRIRRSYPALQRQRKTSTQRAGRKERKRGRDDYR
jgi:hypothetical protein